MPLLLATLALVLTLAAPASAAPTWLQPTGLGADVADTSSIGSVAVAPDGTAVAAWAQATADGMDFNLQVSRRLPGEGFGPATTVPGTSGAGQVDVGIDGAGNATVSWLDGGAVRVLAMPRDGGPGAAQTVDGAGNDGLVVAVGVQGRAVLAWSDTSLEPGTRRPQRGSQRRIRIVRGAQDDLSRPSTRPRSRASALPWATTGVLPSSGLERPAAARRSRSTTARPAALSPQGMGLPDLGSGDPGFDAIDPGGRDRRDGARDRAVDRLDAGAGVLRGAAARTGLGSDRPRVRRASTSPRPRLPGSRRTGPSSPPGSSPREAPTSCRPRSAPQAAAASQSTASSPARR